MNQYEHRGDEDSPLLVFFSSVSENTARFVKKLSFRSARIPIYRREEPLTISQPYVLVVPTYGGGDGHGAVPKQVIRFLNDSTNRANLRGVISAGNTNFGSAFCLAGDIISRKCAVPHLYRVELFGTEEDCRKVTSGLREWWPSAVHSTHEMTTETKEEDA